MNRPADTDVDWVATTHRRLARVWIDFESALVQVPVIARLLSRRLRLEDYQRLLVNLRQQVIEGSRWISRAASSITPAHEELRTMFLDHAMAEHRDFRLLEKNYVATGGDLAVIRGADKNVGSEALSGFMYHAASKPDPIGLLGAMFIIEGLGSRLAGPWAKLVQDQLGLDDDAVAFFNYHGEDDEHHMGEFDRAIALAAVDEPSSDAIVKHAKVVARLYRLQLEELDHV